MDLSKILRNEINVAKILDEDQLTEIGTQVVEDFERDKNTRTDWEKRTEGAMKLALQVAEEKTYPWPKAANVKYPLLTLSAIQFASRVELFQGPDIVKCQVNGFDPDGSKTDKGIRISKHMSYQFRQMPEWEEDNDRMYHALPILGSMFKKSYYDPIKERNISELIYPRDLVFDYYAKDVDSCSRKTHVLYMTKNKIIERQRKGIFLKIELTSDPDTEERSLARQVEGVEQPENDKATPRPLLEQHCYMDLDEDDYQEPYIVTVDYTTKKVLRIIPRFDKSSIKRSKGEILCIESDEYFTQFIFIPDPNGGNLGIGFGNLQGPLNEVANTIINQLIDAGTLSNMQSGFIGKGLRTKAGNYAFTPGEWKFVNSSGEDMKNNIIPMPVREPSQVLFTLLTLILEGGEKIGSITDAIVGDNPPANQPATTTMATIEQGLKVFKKIHVRLYRCFSKEFEKHYRLNKKYIDSREYFDVLDIPMSQMQLLQEKTQQTMQETGQMMVVQSDYKGDDTELTPSADPNVMTETEKLQKIEMLLQTIPVLGWNPEVIKKRFLEATNMPNPDELLTPPPPPPPDPKIELEKMKMQGEQQKMQMEMQIKQQEAGFKQQELQINLQQMAAEAEKVKVEIQKIQAEIQKIQMEAGDGSKQSIEQAKLKMEGHKILADHDIKTKELMLKEKELSLKAHEIETNAQLTRETGQQQMAMKQQDMNMQQQQMAHDDVSQDKQMEHEGELHASEQKTKIATSKAKAAGSKKNDKGKSNP